MEAPWLTTRICTSGGVPAAAAVSNPAGGHPLAEAFDLWHGRHPPYTCVIAFVAWQITV